MVPFDKEKSKQLKGIAILFMFWIHLYCHDDKLHSGIYYLSVFTGDNLWPIKFILKICSVCVPLFIFMAGYAYGVNLEEKKSIRVWPVIKKLYTKYWLVFVVFVPICIASGAIEFNFVECLKNYSGFFYSYCGEWWFFSLYIELETVSFIIYKLGGWKKDIRPVIIVSLFLMCVGYGLKVVVPTVTNGNTILNQVYTFLIKQPIYISGFVFAKGHLFEKLDEKIKKLWPFLLVGWVFEFTNIPESFYLPLVIPGIVCAFCHVRMGKRTGKILSFLGNQSTYMWLTHSLLIYKLLQPVVYGLHYSILNYCILLAIDIPIAIILLWIEKSIVKLTTHRA